MTEDRLTQIVEFCKLIDKEKFVQRRTYLSEVLERNARSAEGTQALWEFARKVQRFLSQPFSVAEQFTGVPGAGFLR